MTKYLLDANLSPKTGRYLAATFGLDVESLHGLRLGGLSDPEVARRALRSGRVVITLDSDFESANTGLFEASQGVIYLDLPNEFRPVREVNRILGGFFSQQSADLLLEDSLIVITPDGIDISRTIRRLRPNP